MSVLFFPSNTKYCLCTKPASLLSLHRRHPDSLNNKKSPFLHGKELFAGTWRSHRYNPAAVHWYSLQRTLLPSILSPCYCEIPCWEALDGLLMPFQHPFGSHTLVYYSKEKLCQFWGLIRFFLKDWKSNVLQRAAFSHTLNHSAAFVLQTWL